MPQTIEEWEGKKLLLDLLHKFSLDSEKRKKLLFRKYFVVGEFYKIKEEKTVEFNSNEALSAFKSR